MKGGGREFFKSLYKKKREEELVKTGREKMEGKNRKFTGKLKLNQDVLYTK
jgi:hypothetical protein